MKIVSKVVIYYTDGTYEEFNKNYVMPPMPSPWPPATYPYNPDPSYLQAKCNTCGVNFNGPMGYVCGRSDCPSNIRCSGESNGS